MKYVRVAVVLLVHYLFVDVCLGQNAVIGAFGGLGDTPQKTAPDLMGGTWGAGTHSFAYSISYRQQLRRWLYGSFTYLNQGHYDRHGYRTNHHSRDDAQVELLLAKRPGNGRLEFQLGGGPAYYSETDEAGDWAGDFQNHQGFGLALGGMVDLDITDRLFVELRAHRHLVLNRYPTTNAMLGLGYRWERGQDQASPAEKPSKHFIRTYYGLGTLNSKQSESLKRSLLVTHEIDAFRYFGTAVSYLREGDARKLNRAGIAVQGIVREEIAGTVTLSFGLGPYINVDRSDFFRRQDKISVDALFTAFLDFRVTRRLELSLSTSRPRSLTTLRDKPMTDVYHAGLKVRLR